MEVDLTIVSIFISTATLLFTLIKVYVSQERRITRLETKMELFWDAVSSQALDFLHHPNTERKDILLNKLKENYRNLTISELEELRSLLECDMINEKGTIKGWVAAFSLAQVKSLLIDQGALAHKMMKQ